MIEDQPLGICPATLVAEPLTASAEDIRAAAVAAVDAGFTHASVWLFHFDTLGGDGGRAAGYRAMEDLELRVSVVEAALQWATGDLDTARNEAAQFADAVTATGATRIGAVCLEPTLPDLNAARRNLAVMVDAAERVGASVSVEFLPWTGIPDLATAWALVEPLGPNATVLLDTWHWQRQPGGPALDVLASVPGERIGYVQLCDASATPEPDAYTECMNSRLLPGSGIVDFASLFWQLDAIGAAPVVAAETFNTSLVTHAGPAAAARQMWESCRDVLNGTPSPPR